MLINDLLQNWNQWRKEHPAKVVDFIDLYNASLGLKAENLIAKKALLTESESVFYRALPVLFYADLFYYNNYQEKAQLLNRRAPRILINGDIHLENFGFYRGPNGSVVWGINDFDQSEYGSIEWDLARLATSIILATSTAKLTEKNNDFINLLCNTYFFTLDQIRNGEEQKMENNYGIAYLSSSEVEGVVKSRLDKVKQKNQALLLSEFLSDHLPSFKSQDNEVVPLNIKEQEASFVISSLQAYQQQLGFSERLQPDFQITAVARLVGKGGSSFGLSRFLVLVEQVEKEKIILEVKQLLASSIRDQSGNLTQADGRRVLIYQRALNGYINALNSAINTDQGSFLVRELEWQKDKVNTKKLKTVDEFNQLIGQAAKVLARSHAHTMVQAEEIVKWCDGEVQVVSERLLSFANEYSTQTVADFSIYHSNTQ